MTGIRNLFFIAAVSTGLLANAAEMPPALRTTFLADRYKVVGPVAGGFRASNASQHFAVAFRDNSTEIAAGDSCFRFVFAGYGWGGKTKTPGNVTQMTASGNRLIRVYASGLREWFVNDAQGLGEGFVVEKRRGPGTLTIRLELGGLEFSGVQAWDARGVATAVRVSAEGQDVVMEIGDGETLYPLTAGPICLRRAGAIPGDGSDDGFHLSVALSRDGSMALVGALQKQDVANRYQGSVYFYRGHGTSWTEQQELKASDGVAGDGFGAAVALSGEGAVALVGAPDKQVGRDRWRGAAYVFTRSGDGWREDAKLMAEDGVENDVFGFSAALSEDGRTALLGAPYKMVGGNPQQGAAYVFARGGTGAWTEQAELRSHNGAANAQFGATVEWSSDGAVVSDRVTQYAFVRRGPGWSPRPERSTSRLGEIASERATVAAPYKTMLVTPQASQAGAICLPSGGQVAATLGFVVQPVSGVVGAALSPAVKVQVRDSTGVPVTGSSAVVTVTSTPAGIAQSVNAVAGVATFTNLIFSTAGNYTLTASSAGLASTVSGAFSITAPSASRLVFATQPLNATAGTALNAVVVQVQDAVGNVVTSSNVAVTIGAASGEFSATATAVNGIARFNGMTSHVPGTYSLAASTPGLATAISSSFTYLMTAAKAGVFRNGTSVLEDSNGNGSYDAVIDRFIAGFTGPGGFLSGDIPVAGDWTGDGKTKVGIYRTSTGTWYLDANNNGVYDAGDYKYAFGGLADDAPFVGDWLGTGKACIGIYRVGGSVWLLDLNCNGSFDNTPADAFFPFGGLAGDVPVVGSWTGIGTRVGVVRKYAPGGVPQGNAFYWVLDGGAANAGNLPVNHPAAAVAFGFGGLAGDVFVTGDWYGTGMSAAGVYRNGFWVLDGALPNVASQASHLPGVTFGYGGIAGDVPVSGKW